MKNDLYYFLRSLFLTSTVSSCFGLFFMFFNKPFLQIFFITFGIQIFLSFLYSEYLKYLSSKTNALLYIEELNKLEKLSTLLNCSYCNETNVITFLPEEVPNFTCTKCENINNVKLVFSVARASSPAPSINDFNKIISEPQQNHNIQY